MKNNKSKPLVIIQCYEDRQQTLPLRKAEYDTADVATNTHAPLKREATDNPPPPPPMPKTNEQQNGESKTVTSQKSINKPFNQDVIKAPHLRNGSLTRTPTPDYNNKTDPVQSKLNGTKDERAELESLESYKLKNPVNALPKPPSTYFMRAPNGTATMKKIARPVSVTIGEYANGGRREPIKLDFLNGDKSEGTNDAGDVPITNRLQSELALTLSRSNLRKKTEALDNSISKRYFSRATNDDSDASIDKNFHARYGNNILPLPPSADAGR